MATTDKPTYGMANIASCVGQPLGVSDWLTVDQDMIDRFADCTGDHQWIHVDPVRAGKDPQFGSTIAHGFLVLSLLSRFAGEIGIVPPDARGALNYGLDRLRFIQPVRVNAKIRDRVSLKDVTPKGDGSLLLSTEHVVEIEGEDKPAMIATFLILLLP